MTVGRRISRNTDEGDMRAILNSPYFLWALLCIPAVPMTVGALSGNPNAFHQLLHPTGEFAARFMIIAMMATPLMMALPGWRGPRWMVRNRRYFGVAALAYALAHTVFYLIDVGIAGALDQATKLSIWTGWLAFLVFVPLAVTSNNKAVRVMGPAWKRLQRWVYGAAILTLIHWAALHDWGGVGPAMVHFGPLAALSIWRAWATRTRRTAA